MQARASLALHPCFFKSVTLQWKYTTKGRRVVWEAPRGITHTPRKSHWWNKIMNVSSLSNPVLDMGIAEGNHPASSTCSWSREPNSRQNVANLRTNWQLNPAILLLLLHEVMQLLSALWHFPSHQVLVFTWPLWNLVVFWFWIECFSGT